MLSGHGVTCECLNVKCEMGNCLSNSGGGGKKEAPADTKGITQQNNFFPEQVTLYFFTLFDLTSPFFRTPKHFVQSPEKDLSTVTPTQLENIGKWEKYG